MFKKIAKALTVAAIGIGLGAPVIAAPTSFVTPTYVGEGTAFPGVRILLPACASGDTVSFIMNAARVMAWNYSGNTTAYPYMTVMWALGAQAAGDSVSVAVDIGARPLNYSPGWLAIDTHASYLNTLGGNQTITGTTIANPVKLSHTITSTWLAAPYWRVRVLTKSTIAAGTQFEVRFPHQSGVPK